MRAIYLREYTWGLGSCSFKTREEAELFDFPEDFLRVVMFMEVA